MQKTGEADRARPRIAVGIMGSAGGNPGAAIFQKAYAMGRSIARRGCILVTGACPGLPHEAVKGAKSENGIVIGISPALNFEEHALKYKAPYAGYDVLVYTGSGLMGRGAGILRCVRRWRRERVRRLRGRMNARTVVVASDLRAVIFIVIFRMIIFGRFC